MGIGLGVFLVVIGGILAFTRLDDSLLNTNLDAVGYILVIGGVLALVFGTIQNRQRANTSHTSVVERRNIEEGNVQHDVRDVRDVRDDRREP
jgi:drug/metabolite transporter (DMT)-like permease